MTANPPIPTVAHMLGEMTWVLSQSPIYKHMKIADLEWMVMPPMLLGQYRVFHQELTPIGFALWASLSEEVERRMNDAVANGVPVRLEPKDWKSGDRLWLIELICPTATPENNLTQSLMADLIKTVFKDRPFSFHQIQFDENQQRKIKTLTLNPPVSESMTMQ